MQEDHTSELIEQQPRSRRGVLRTALFAAIGLAIAALLVAQQLGALIPHQRRPQQQRLAGTAERKQVDLVAQYAVFAVRFAEKHNIAAAMPVENKTELADTIEELVHGFDDPVLYRRAGVVTMWLDPSQSRYENFLSAVKLRAQEDPRSAEAEASLWKVLYAPQEQEARLTARQWQRLEPLLDQFKMGPWYADLVRLRANELLERPEKATELRRKVYEASYQRLVPLLLLGSGVFLAGLVGCLVVIAVLVLLGTGRLTSVGIPLGLPVRPLWETVILYFGLMSLAPLAIEGIGGLIHWTPPPVVRALAGQLLAACSVFWIASARPAIQLSSVGLRVRALLGDVLCGLAGYCAALPLLVVAAGAVYLLQKLLPEAPPPTHPAVEDVLGAEPSVAALVGLFVAAVVLAPLIEEMFFRGVMQSALRQQIGPQGAIALSALIFALAHPQGPLGVPVLFVLGAVFAALRELRGSILPGVVAHAINNGVVLTVLYLAMFR